MTQTLRKVLLASAVLLVIAPAFASAPVDQYAAFNRQNDTIYDQQTKLTWQRFVTRDQRSQSDAMNACATLTLEGKTWRLPTVKELLTLVDEQPHSEYRLDGTGVAVLAIDGRAFPDTPDLEFWSSSYAAGKAWSVDFSSGEARRSNAGNLKCVRCVSDSR